MPGYVPGPPSKFITLVSPLAETSRTAPLSSPFRICGFLTISKVPFTTGFGNTNSILPIT